MEEAYSESRGIPYHQTILERRLCYHAQKEIVFPWDGVRAGASAAGGAADRPGPPRRRTAREDLKVPIIAFITGEGGSGGALALALANKVYILENAVYSVLSPEGFATILWKDGSRRDEAAELMKITAPHLLEMGLVDAIISEENLIENLKRQLTESLGDLSLLTETELAEQRYERFRKY